MSDDAAWAALGDALAGTTQSRAAGLTREQISAGMAAEAAATATQARDAQGRFAGAVHPGQVGTLPDDAAIQARAAELVASGEMTQEQADRALAHYGAVPLPDDGHAEPAKSDAPTGPLAPSGAPNPFESLELPAGFEPPESPEKYRFDQVVASSMTIAELKAVAETCHAARLAAPIAVQLVSEIGRMAAQPLDDADHRRLIQQTNFELERLYGGKEAAAAKVKVAADFVRELDKVRPGLWDLLNTKTQAGSNFVVLRQLIEHAERVNAARRK